MAECITAMGRFTVGLDLGDKHTHLCILNEDGQILEESRVLMTAEALKLRFGSMAPARVAMEVGTHSAWVSRLIQGEGHEVLVANARKLRLIYENDGKNDQVDARYLARLARMDPSLLSPIEHRSRQTQEDLAVLRARDALVQARTKLINHVRGAVKAMGGRIPKVSSAAFGKRAGEAVMEGLKPALEPVLEAIRKLTEQIGVGDTRAEAVAKERYPQTAALQQVAGVGPVTSLAFVLTLEDPARFKKSRQVGAYLGLRPRQSQSGMSDPELKITKAGDGFLRRLLVGSAQYILGPFGPDTDLRRWGQKLAGGGKTAKKRAVVAVARKLAVLLHRLWVTNQPYVPIRKVTTN